MSLHRVVMFEGGWGVFYYIRFLLERGEVVLKLTTSRVKFKRDSNISNISALFDFPVIFQNSGKWQLLLRN